MDAYRRETIGFIFQSFNLVAYLSVIDNIMISLKMTRLSEEERRDRAIELTKQVGLYDHRKKKPSQLSGGQKQRVAIARALASDPEIILADEPTGALDSQNTKEVLAILRQIAESGKTVIVVTHSQEVADYGTRIIRLADGQITGDERIKPAYQATAETKIQSKALSYWDVVKTGFKHFMHTWKLNLLIAIGTAIGLASVMFFLGLGNGAIQYMNSQVTSLANPNVVAVFQRGDNNQNKDNNQALGVAQQNIAQGNSTQYFSSSDLSKLESVKNVKSVEKSYMISGQGQAQLGTSSANLSQLRSWSSILTSSSVENGSVPKDNEVVVPESVAKQLDANDFKSVIGKHLTINMMVRGATGPATISMDLKISGVTQPIPGNNALATTYTTLENALKSANVTSDPNMAIVTVNTMNNVKQATEDINGLKTNDKLMFATNGVGSILDSITNIMLVVTIVLLLISGVSLIVSAFMIIVTTYMSVTERTKEIGIIRAMGGRKKDISRLFITESIILGLFSAMIAFIFAIIGQAVVNAFVNHMNIMSGSNIIHISVIQVIVAVLIAILIAILASLAPSVRAARLNTIEALASE